jgi:tRNA (cytidine/uridine-2'-O-)-methyltransferase
MFHLILYQPEIPPNTGNVIRLCANVGCSLHLIHPLGFSMDERRLRRAGLDYRDVANVREHESLEDCLASAAARRVFALTTKAHHCFFAPRFVSGDAFLLGPETRGLPPEVLREFPAKAVLGLPMRPGNRSLNLSNRRLV